MEKLDLSHMLKGCIEVDGSCEKHGPRTILMFKRFAENGWYCPVCRDEEAMIAAQEKWKQERNDTLHRIAGIPLKYQGQRFSATTTKQKAVRGQVKAFRDVIAEKPAWAVLVLFGGVGTGKTLMAAELAESLINGLSMSVRYCTTKQMIAEIQASYNTEGKTEEGEILRFVQYGLLILDEIDAKPDRENANLLLTEVINRRYNEEKPVVVITNQPFNNLAKFVGDRVDDRLHENAFVCSFDWPSFRRVA
jgi:DNA replication protein DnaC